MILFLAGFATAFALSLAATLALTVTLRHRSTEGQLTEEEARVTAEEMIAELGDSIRYASAIITVGYDPDQPDYIAVAGHVGPGRTVCNGCVGAALVDVGSDILGRTPGHRGGHS